MVVIRCYQINKLGYVMYEGTPAGLCHPAALIVVWDLGEGLSQAACRLDRQDNYAVAYGDFPPSVSSLPGDKSASVKSVCFLRHFNVQSLLFIIVFMFYNQSTRSCRHTMRQHIKCVTNCNSTDTHSSPVLCLLYLLYFSGLNVKS